MRIVVVLIVCLAVLVGLLALVLRHRKRNESDERDWCLLLFPADGEDPQERTVARLLRRLRLEARTLSETGMEPATALERLRPSLVIAHQPAFGDLIARLEETDSALASTPVLLLETRISRGHSNLRVQLPPGAKPARIGGAIVDLLGQRPTERELSRRGAVAVAIEPGKVAEFLDFLHSMGKTGKIEIRTNQITGGLWMENGLILHAVVGRLEGLPALHSMLDFVQGTIAFAPGPVSIRRTIQDGAMAVLAEYARRRDELAKASGN